MAAKRLVGIEFQQSSKTGEGHETLLDTVGHQLSQKVDESGYLDNVSTPTDTRVFRVRRTDELLNFIDNKDLTLVVNSDKFYKVVGYTEPTTIDVDILTETSNV